MSKAGKTRSLLDFDERCAEHGAQTDADEGKRQAADHLVGAQCDGDEGVQQRHQDRRPPQATARPVHALPVA